jgi:hypothetical protein
MPEATTDDFNKKKASSRIERWRRQGYQKTAKQQATSNSQGRQQAAGVTCNSSGGCTEQYTPEGSDASMSKNAGIHEKVV